MTELKCPICPICKQEVLLPLSIMQVGATISEKTYGNWICSNCGFYLTTRDTRAINPENDIEAGVSKKLVKKVAELKQQHYDKQLKS